MNQFHFLLLNYKIIFKLNYLFKFKNVYKFKKKINT